MEIVRFFFGVGMGGGGPKEWRVDLEVALGRVRSKTETPVRRWPAYVRPSLEPKRRGLPVVL